MTISGKFAALAALAAAANLALAGPARADDLNGLYNVRWDANPDNAASDGQWAITRAATDASTSTATRTDGTRTGIWQATPWTIGPFDVTDDCTPASLGSYRDTVTQIRCGDAEVGTTAYCWQASCGGGPSSTQAIALTKA
jgi:hypothetical protein